MKRQRLMLLGSVLVLILALVACGPTPPANHAPQFDATTFDPDTTSFTVNVSQVVAFFAEANDEDGNQLSYSWTCSGGTLDGNTGTSVSWTAPNSVGNYTVKVTVTDGTASDSHTWNIAVQTGSSGGNNAPEITSVSPTSPLTVEVDTVQNLSVIATDADGDSLTYSWAKSGGTLNSTDHTATWTAPGTEGNYTVTATVSDGTDTDSYTWTITTSTEPVNDVVLIDSNITTTQSWTSDHIYVIDGYIEVEQGAVLTIEPGTIIKFKEYSSLTVYGVIKANGVQADPIYFTSYLDDLGGDTNGDGTATTPVPGSWISLKILNNGSNLDYTHFYYGGNTSGEDNTVYVGTDYGVAIRNCTFAYNKGAEYGVVDLGKAAATTVLTNNNFYANEMPLNINPDISLDDSNTFAKPDDSTIKNTYETILVTDDYLDTAVNWSETEIAFLIEDWVEINAGGSLEIEEGVTVKFAEQAYLTVSGVINATNAIFTSLLDDQFGGDSNGDADATAPIPGSWGRIEIYNNGSSFDSCKFYYGGQTSSDHTVALASGYSISITDCLFAHNKGQDDGVVDVRQATADTIITGNVFYDNEMPLFISPVIDLDDSNIFAKPDDTTVKNTYEMILVDNGYVTTDVTWSETEVAFVIDDWLEINDNASLSVTSDVAVKFGAGAYLTANGVLSGENAVFTSLLDDRFGGDSNGDGNATNPVRGDWNKIYVNDNDTELNNCSFLYGGKTGTVMEVYEAAPTISSCSFGHNDGEDGALNLVNASPQVSVTNNYFYDNLLPLVISGDINIDDSNEFTNPDTGEYNDFQQIKIVGSYVHSNTIWNETEAAYWIDDWLEITTDGTLILTDGVTIKLDSDAYITAGGIISATGVTFTSYRDDNYGGNSNNDDATPARGDWDQIYITGGSANDSVFENCRFMYGGSLIIDNCRASITNSVFEENGVTGEYTLDLSHALNNTTVTGNSFVSNMRPILINGQINIDDSNSFPENDYNGIFVRDGYIEAAISWAETEVPFVIGVNGWLEIDADYGSLSLGDYVVLKFRTDAYMTIHDNLYQGMGGAFTSWKDDIRGGDTNNDGNLTSPAPGDWDGIYNEDNPMIWLNIFYDNY